MHVKMVYVNCMGYLIFLSSFYVEAQRRTLSDVEYYCGNKPADIVFLLDVSNSIWGPDFQKQLDFVSDVIGMFEIADNITRVGITAFGSHVYRQFYLNDYYDRDDMRSAVQRIRQYHGYSTNTGLALWHMRNTMFSEEHGARQGVAQVCIVLTDGHSQNMERTIFEAFKAKSENITIFAIGIGKNINRKELIGIASEPTSEFMFTVDGFYALNAIINTLAVRTCKVTTPTHTTTTTFVVTTPASTTSVYDFVQRQCSEKRIDVVFAIDSSSNILDANYIKQADFFKKLTESFDISPRTTRVGFLLYRDRIQEVFNVGDYESRDEVVKGLDKLGMTAGANRVDLVLQHIIAKSFRRSFSRPDTSQVGVVITGSPSRNIEISKHMAKKASKVGTQFIIIGIGDLVNEEELKIVADSNIKHIFQLQNFDELYRIIPDVAIQICEVPVLSVPVNDQSCSTKQEVDIIFLVDSVNAGKHNTRKALEFVKSLIHELDVDNGNVHAGLMTADCEQDIKGFDLAAYESEKFIDKAFDSIKGTNFFKILRNMRLSAFTSNRGARRHARKVAILIIDGNLEQPHKTLTEAQKARMLGIEVFVVQVGDEDTQEEVLKMCNEPSSQHFYTVKTYAQLLEVKSRLLDSLCDEL